MKAGTLRHRVTITQPTTTIDAYGQEVESYGDAVTVWADVKEQALTEAQVEDGTATIQAISVIVRRPVTLTARSRVQYDGRTFDVKSIIDPDGVGAAYEVRAERKV